MSPSHGLSIHAMVLQRSCCHSCQKTSYAYNTKRNIATRARTPIEKLIGGARDWAGAGTSMAVRALGELSPQFQRRRSCIRASDGTEQLLWPLLRNSPSSEVQSLPRNYRVDVK